MAITEMKAKRAYDITDYDEILETIRTIPNKEVRRILRTIVRACKRINGKPVFSAWEDLYVFRCYTEEPMDHIIFSHHGGGGVVSIISPELFTEFKLPEDWTLSMSMSAGEGNIYGFRAEIKEMEGEWKLDLVPLKHKMPSYYR